MKWRKELIQTLNPPEGDDFPFVLLGNKNDLKELIKVKQEDIDKYCQKHKNMPYFSVSAQLNINIEEGFFFFSIGINFIVFGDFSKCVSRIFSFSFFLGY